MGKVVGLLLGLISWIIIQLIDFVNMILVWAEKAQREADNE